MKFNLLSGRGFRSVVHSEILSERPATLAIILMARPIGNDGMLKPALKGSAPVYPVRMDYEAELRRQWKQMN